MESLADSNNQLIRKLEQILNYQIQDPKDAKVDEILKLLHAISTYQIQDPKDANIRQLVEQTQLIVERLNQLQQILQTSPGNVQTSPGNVQTFQTGVMTNTIKLNDMTHFLWFVVGGLMFLAALKIIVA
jgi:hypothetical protein